MTANDIVHIKPDDLISQGPGQIKSTVLKILAHCAATTFPTEDLSPGRMAYILESAGAPNGGCLFMYRGQLPAGGPNWVKLMNIADVPATIGYVNTQLALKQDKITGAATTVLSAPLSASKALVSDASGKIGASSLPSSKLAHLSGVTSEIQAQLNGKQPNIVANTVDPVSTAYPENTVWLVYV